MSAQDLFNQLAEAGREQAEVLVAALSEDALREVGAHIAREGEGNGPHGDVCGLVVMESWCRFMAQGEELEIRNEELGISNTVNE